MAMNKTSELHAVVMWMADREDIVTVVDEENGLKYPAISAIEQDAIAMANQCHARAQELGCRLKVVTFKRDRTVYIHSPVRNIEDPPPG